MEIHSVEAYRTALEELKRLGADDPRRHDLEAAVQAYAQEHNNSRGRRGRPPARGEADSPRFREDRS